MGSRNGICYRLRTRTLLAVDVQRGASSPALSRRRKFKGKEQLVLHAREHVAEVENELQKIRDGIQGVLLQDER